MKRKSLALATLLLAATTVSPVRPAMTERDVERVRGQAMGDAEILAFLFAVNAHEVETARLALQKSESDEIRGLARRLRQDHGAGVQKSVELARRVGVTPVLAEPVMSLEEQTTEGLARIARLEGDEFDRVFLDTVIAEHQLVLETIDNQLLPNARHPELPRHLQATRRLVAAHLDEAMRLRDRIR